MHAAREEVAAAERDLKRAQDDYAASANGSPVEFVAGVRIHYELMRLRRAREVLEATEIRICPPDEPLCARK